MRLNTMRSPKFDALNDPQFDAKARKCSMDFGFEEQFERPASDLSGGWSRYAHLARLVNMRSLICSC